MHFSTSLLMLLPLTTWCTPNPQSVPPPTTATTAPSSPSSSPQSRSPTPPAPIPAPVGGSFTPQGKQEVIRANFMNYDNRNISAMVDFKCNPTQSSPELTDVETLSAHYLTNSTPSSHYPAAAWAPACRSGRRKMSALRS
ncbi:hypothetical protein C7212DRAFT_364120 [Tuber magnatum]|uniref:Uncharacterized protein n=1 Tax=Tuber magnatum TaxID=42249 RepID=A0A317SPF9_9PEZI|nr:hypothetical protein C7212DRAFT_364120 [Tuber magnatum]